MARPKRRDRHLPPLMRFRRGRYYYGRDDVALGGDLPTALRKYAELHAGRVDATTFADVAARYMRDGMKQLAEKTKREYVRQLTRDDGGLIKAFGAMAIEQIRPVHVRQYLTKRGDSIAGTREKATLSAVISFARNAGLYDGPNPCAGIRGRKSKRDVYVTDAMMLPVLGKLDATTADYVETLWRTGADPGVAALWRAENVRDGSLHVQRTKTGQRVRIELAGPLAAIVERRLSGRVGNVYLFARDDGNPIGLQVLRRRFVEARDAVGQAFWLRDLRAKAASDSDDLKSAQTLLGHADESTAARYRRQRIGEQAKPITRKIGGKE